MNKKPVFIASIIFGSIIFIAIMIWLIIPSLSQTKTVSISNLNDCAPNSSRDPGRFLYSYIIAANTELGRETADHYDAQIRTDSCTTVEANSFGFFMSEFIVDIPEAQQSWHLSYIWSDSTIPESQLSSDFDPGPFLVTCLPSNQLIYPSFNCESIPTIKEDEALYNVDPIFSHLPHSTLTYNIVLGDRTGDKVALDITIQLSAADERIDPDAAIEEYKEEAISFIKSLNLDPNNYDISYSVIRPALL